MSNFADIPGMTRELAEIQLGFRSRGQCCVIPTKNGDFQVMDAKLDAGGGVVFLNGWNYRQEGEPRPLDRRDQYAVSRPAVEFSDDEIAAAVRKVWQIPVYRDEAERLACIRFAEVWAKTHPQQTKKLMEDRAKANGRAPDPEESDWIAVGDKVDKLLHMATEGCGWATTLTRAISDRNAPLCVHYTIDQSRMAASRAYFTEVTGVKLPKTQRDSEAAVRLWCAGGDRSVMEEQLAAEARAKDIARAGELTRRAERAAEAREASLKAERVNANGKSTNYADFYEECVTSGYRLFRSASKGAAKSWKLMHREGRWFDIKTREHADFIADKGGLMPGVTVADNMGKERADALLASHIGWLKEDASRDLDAATSLEGRLQGECRDAFVREFVSHGATVAPWMNYIRENFGPAQAAEFTASTDVATEVASHKNKV